MRYKDFCGLPIHPLLEHGEQTDVNAAENDFGFKR
jgi:hypothetical protein